MVVLVTEARGGHFYAANCMHWDVPDIAEEVIRYKDDNYFRWLHTTIDKMVVKQ